MIAQFAEKNNDILCCNQNNDSNHKDKFNRSSIVNNIFCITTRIHKNNQAIPFNSECSSPAREPIQTNKILATTLRRVGQSSLLSLQLARAIK